jgi:hypothetical protein
VEALVNTILKALILLTLGLAACTECPDTDASTLVDDSPQVQFVGHDDAGRLMMKDGAYWKQHVAVYSVDANLQGDAQKLVQMNFNVHLVPVPGSRVLIRLIPEKNGRITVSAQHNGQLHSKSLPKSKKGLRDECVQDAFLEFVSLEMDLAVARK